MIAIKLCGGLGNTLFQFALGLALEAKGRSVQYDISAFDSDPARRYLLDDFGLKLPTVKTNAAPTMCETSLLYDPRFIEAKSGDVLQGYFQSEKYFEHLGPYIRGIIFEKMAMSEKTRELALKIAALGSSSCFVHIRRSDNLRPTSTLYHGLTELNSPYYKRAYLKALDIPNVHFFVFSDDPKWAEQNVHFSRSRIETETISTVVSHNMPSFIERTDHNLLKTDLGREVEDLYLMSLCKHAIIANSTFSWWGAYLHSPPKNEITWDKPDDRIVIAPDPWYSSDEAGPTEIIPDRWLKVSTK